MVIKDQLQHLQLIMTFTSCGAITITSESNSDYTIRTFEHMTMGHMTPSYMSGNFVDDMLIIA